VRVRKWQVRSPPLGAFAAWGRTGGRGFPRDKFGLRSINIAPNCTASPHKADLRTLEPRSGIDFASQRLFGTRHFEAPRRRSDCSALKEAHQLVPEGRDYFEGNVPEHEELEAAAADVLSFGNARSTSAAAYVANYAVLSTLPQKGDLIVPRCGSPTQRRARGHARRPGGKSPARRTTTSGRLRRRSLNGRCGRAVTRGRGVDRNREPLQHGRRSRPPLDDLMALADRP